MAEANVSLNAPKKRRSTGERGIQFSLNVELPRNQESRLLGMRYRIKMAKSSLNLSKATSSTQNADLLEALQLAFEEKVERSKETSCVSSLLANQLTFVFWIFIQFIRKSSFVSKTRCYFNSKIANVSRFWCSRTRVTRAIVPIRAESSPPVFRPQKFQISTQATQDDPIYFVSEEALRSLFSFFTVKLMAKCCFCGKGYDAELFHSKGRVMQCLWTCPVWVSGHLATRESRHQPTRHQAKSPRHQAKSSRHQTLE